MPKVSPNIRAYVKRAIHSHIEDKVVFNNNVNQVVSMISGSTPPGFSCIPSNLSQGVGVQNRVGNSIKCTGGTIDMYVNLLPYNATTNPQPCPVWIRALLVSNRVLQGVSLGTTNASNDFFDYNNGITGLQQNIRDITLPINTDNWIVWDDQRRKLGYSSVIAASTVQNTVAFCDSSPFSVQIKFDYGQYLKSAIKFSDAVNTPTNKNMYVIVLAAYADGTTTGISPAEFHYQNTFKFEDA